MKKKSKRKPRQESIYATTSMVVDNILLSYDPKTNTIRFETDVKDTYNEISYERAKGPKVISRTPQSGFDLSFSNDEAIENNYEMIFAIDTNTRNIKGVSISVTGIIQAQKVFAVDEKGIASTPWQYFTPFCIELLEVRGKPENLGWVLVIDHINKSYKYQVFTKIGLIVDSDLGNLKLYNSREKPIFENFYLPKRFQLIYASSDTGKDLFSNQMLKYADKASTQCLEALNNGVIPLNTKRIRTKYYSGIRHLYSKYR